MKAASGKAFVSTTLTYRFIDLIVSDKLLDDLGVPRLNSETDRAMMCGAAG
jgi:hypothetical protein